jgi:hypothetical protein
MAKKKEGGLVGYADSQRGGGSKSLFPSLDQIQKGIRKPNPRSPKRGEKRWGEG